MLLGAGYDDAAVEEMRKACKDAGVTNGIPWLRPDTTKPAPPLGPEYGKALVARIKELMGHLADQHKLDEDAVLYY